MAKYWEPGRVKTRLGKSIGMENAARVHRLFVEHLVSELDSDVADRRCLIVAPATHVEKFMKQLPGGWTGEPQTSGDLGNRMSHWFQSHLESSTSCVLIGADCPQISREVIGRAFDQLQSRDLVLGPARDGGYYLIGIRGPYATRYSRLWEGVPWSTDEVFSITTQRASDLGIDTACLEPMEDVDTIVELERLRDALSQTSHAGERRLRETLKTILDDEG